MLTMHTRHGGFWSRLIRANVQLIVTQLRWLADILEQGAPGPPIAATPVLFINTKEIAVGEITVQDDVAPLQATVKFLDSKGAETTPDDTPQWSSTDEAVASVIPSDDGMSAEVAVGTPGAAVIEVRTTETNSNTEVVSQGTVTVQPGDTVMGSVDFSEPT
jgi:hypothetical protein